MVLTALLAVGAAYAIGAVPVGFLVARAHGIGTCLTTILGIFHDLDVLRRLADSYLLLREGRVGGAGEAASVSPEALLAAR